MFIPVPDTIAFQLHGFLPDSVPWSTTIYGHWDAGVPTIDTAFANTFYDGFVAAYQSNNFDDRLSTLWSLVGVTCTDLSTEGGTQAESTHAAIAGLDSTNALPNQCALVCTWKTPVNTRNFRGRTFHPGFTEGDSGGNNPSAATLTAYGDWADDVTALLTDTGRQQVVVSRYDGSQLVGGPGGQVLKRPMPRTTGEFENVTGHVIRTAWSTQRRRALPS